MQAAWRIARTDLFWDDVERTCGTYNFTVYDGVATDLESVGITPLFIFDFENKCYDGGLSPYDKSGRDAFSAYAVAAVTHFQGRGFLWEIYNEPDGPAFWKPSPNATSYALLAQQVHCISQLLLTVTHLFVAGYCCHPCRLPE